MIIYDFLFYNAYKLSKKSDNFRDIPIIGGVIWVVPFLIYNILSIVFFLEGSNIFYKRLDWFIRVAIAAATTILVFTYYYKNKKYLKIINKYDNYPLLRSTIFQLLIIFSYHLLGFIILLISGLYRNKDWIFK